MTRPNTATNITSRFGASDEIVFTMADFDDLIPKSKPITPGFDNPFADAGRPRSPDPWSMGASYYQQPSHEPDPYATSGFQEAASDPYSSYVTPSYEQEAFTAADDPTPTAEIAQPIPTPVAVDPLEADAASKEEESPKKRHPFAPLAVVRAPTPPPSQPPPTKPDTVAPSENAQAGKVASESSTAATQKEPLVIATETSPKVEMPAANNSLPVFNDPRPPSPPTPAQEPSPTLEYVAPVRSSSNTTGLPRPAPPSEEKTRFVSPPTSVPSSPTPTSRLPTSLPVAAAAPDIFSPLGASSSHGFGNEGPGWGSSFTASYNSTPAFSSPGFRAAPQEEEEEDDEDDRPLGLNRNLGSAVPPSASASVDGEEKLLASNVNRTYTPCHLRPIIMSTLIDCK